MPYCPKCRYEYREGVKECPDCGAPLVPSLSEPADRPLRLMELYRGPTPEVQILEEALKQEGIPCIVRPVEPFLGVIGDLLQAMFSQLLISVDDYEERRQTIEDCLQFVGR